MAKSDQHFKAFEQLARAANDFREEPIGIYLKTDSILYEAAQIRGGERNADYGDAVESFEKIARLANEMTGLSLTPAQCCKVMMAVKLVRESYNHKRDNLVDLCGYADILNLIEER